MSRAFGSGISLCGRHETPPCEQLCNLWHLGTPNRRGGERSSIAPGPGRYEGPSPEVDLASPAPTGAPTTKVRRRSSAARSYSSVERSRTGSPSPMRGCASAPSRGATTRRPSTR
jgi:hypothetical protein